MSQADYARHRGVSRQAVGKLLSSGKIPRAALVEGRGGVRLINPIEADFALGHNRERIASLDDADAAAGDAAELNFFSPRPGAARSAPPPAEPAIEPSAETASLTAHRSNSEFYKSEMLRLEHQRRLGELLSTAEVTRAMEKCAAIIVRELDALPNFADDLAAALSRDGAPGVRQLLKNIARDLRGRLEQNMRVAAAEDDAADAEAGAS